MTLKVVGAGFGRTGTHSLKKALEDLGFGPCHHMYEVRNSQRQLDIWSRISAGEEVSWSEVFRGFRSQVDWPASRYWREITQAYPKSKVILTVREPEDWYDSIVKTILPSATLGRSNDPEKNGRIGSEIIYQIVLQDLFQGRFADKDFIIGIFNHHIEQVKAEIAPERLLIFDPRAGWEPLCDFLDVPVPNHAFPSGNTVKEFRSRKGYL